MTTEQIKEFKNALHKRVVKFKYTKRDGSERSAKGTLNIDIMGTLNMPSAEGKHKVSDLNIRYYDLDSEGWRSFVIENLISWE